MKRDPDPPRPEEPAPLPRICRRLRTKTAFGQRGSDALWKLGRSTTAAYWCLDTMEPFGPDGTFCHPDRCGAARGCYRPPDDE